MTSWNPISLEDQLLYNYWEKKGGHLYLEVPIGTPGGFGNWPVKSKTRRIDGVLLREEVSSVSKIFPFKEYNQSEFNEAIRGNTVELIEVKKSLGRYVIGQVIAGVDMFNRQYEAGDIVPVILCIEGDPALEWVCEKRGINVKVSKLSF